jgi:hypothetical protein
MQARVRVLRRLARIRHARHAWRSSLPLRSPRDVGVCESRSRVYPRRPTASGRLRHARLHGTPLFGLSSYALPFALSPVHTLIPSAAVAAAVAPAVACACAAFIFACSRPRPSTSPIRSRAGQTSKDNIFVMQDLMLRYRRNWRQTEVARGPRCPGISHKCPSDVAHRRWGVTTPMS